MMRKILLLFFIALVSFSCNKEKDPGQLAASAAKNYYEQLINGKWDGYVNGLYNPDTIPDNYRQQLIENAKMFVGQMDDEHSGLKRVHIEDAKVDTARHTANVFLIFHYGDSTTEEVVVPMVEAKGKWKLR